MRLGKTLFVANRKEWRAWLARNCAKEKEIWLVYHRKSSGRPRIPYNDAVEEALCYGWIDSTIKNVDEEKFAQRFTPRRRGSAVSEMNKERIRRLIAEKKMTGAGLRAVSGFFDQSMDMKSKFTIARDILSELKADEQAWKNFQEFPDGYKRVRIGYIESRRRHDDEAFRKSLRHFIQMTAKNRKFGMVR